MSNGSPLLDRLGIDLNRLRQDLREDRSGEMRLRRGIVGLSLTGMAAMAAVSLLQTGVVEHLPDPPVEGFDSDKVNTSDAAYQFGAPDGTISLTSLAANIPIAAFGQRGRADTHPWVSIGASAKAGVEALFAGWYFYQMPAREKAWCGYCILGALANAGIFALTVPEARRAIAALRER